MTNPMKIEAHFEENKLRGVVCHVTLAYSSKKSGNISRGPPNKKRGPDICPVGPTGHNKGQKIKRRSKFRDLQVKSVAYVATPNGKKDKGHPVRRERKIKREKVRLPGKRREGERTNKKKGHVHVQAHSP